MIYEVTIQHSVYLENGNEKIKKEQYLIDNCNMFADAEDLMYTQFSNLKNIDVIAIRRSKINEIVNTCNNANDKLFSADIMDVSIDEEGQEHEIVYRVIVWASDIKDAQTKMEIYLKQGMDMQLIALRRTKYVDVYNF